MHAYGVQLLFILIFSPPFKQDNCSEKDINQGTLVVFNLDSSVSNDDLREIFGVYGEIKEASLTSDIELFDAQWKRCLY